MKSRKVLPGLAALLLLAGAVACSKGQKSAAEASVKDMTVTQLAELKKQPGAVHVFDANQQDFREKNGVIPDAVLLASYSKYELSVLPPDKNAKLVFYCTSRL